jgi:hypothetical protein
MSSDQPPSNSELAIPQSPSPSPPPPSFDLAAAQYTLENVPVKERTVQQQKQVNQLYTSSALRQLRDKRRAEAGEKQAIEQAEKTSASGGAPSEQTENLSENPSLAQESSANLSSPSGASAAQIAQQALDLPSTPRRNPARPWDNPEEKVSTTAAKKAATKLAPKSPANPSAKSSAKSTSKSSLKSSKKSSDGTSKKKAITWSASRRGVTRYRMQQSTDDSGDSDGDAAAYDPSSGEEDTGDEGLSDKNDALDDEPEAEQDDDEEEIAMSRFPGVSKESFQAIKRYVWRACHRDYTTQLAQQVQALQSELARINQPSMDPGILTAATLSATRDTIYVRDDFINLISAGNKSGVTGKAMVKPTQRESNRTAKIFRDEYNSPLNSSQAFRFAKLFCRFFLDPKASLSNVIIPFPPPLEPKKPKPEPNSATAVVGIVSDVLSAKESKLKALMIRVGRPALIHYKEGKSGYSLIDSDNAFISKEHVCFCGKFAMPSGLADEEALASKARELHAKSSAEFEVTIEAYRKEWALWKAKQRD